MRTTSTPAIADACDPGTEHADALLVFDSYVDGKPLVTAVILSSTDDPVQARLAKRTRQAALQHQRRLGNGSGAHLVQPFDEDALDDRVASVLAVAQPGALVIFFGRTHQECERILVALGVRLLSSVVAGLQ
jgi:hypothetical protein